MISSWSHSSTEEERKSLLGKRDNGRVMEVDRPRVKRYDSGIGMDSEDCEAFWKEYEAAAEKEEPKQSSIITIFAIWSSMMGSSLLTMPWAFQQAGLVQGICLQLLTAVLAAYTGMLVVKASLAMPDADGNMGEFAVVCQKMIGRFGLILTTQSTVVVFVGALIVYWILMSELLFNSVNSFYYFFSSSVMSTDVNISSLQNVTQNLSDVGIGLLNASNATCAQYQGQLGAEVATIPGWSENRTVPLFLVIIFAPLVQLRSPSFFTRFGASGSIPIIFLIVYCIIKSASWGLHVEFGDSPGPNHIDFFNGNFPALSGLLTMAFFQHNSIVTFFKHSKNPQHIIRDMWTAFSLVVFTYTVIGISIYLSFPGGKDCIRQNFFENIAIDDTLSLVAQLMLFLRLLTLFPLIAYILRVQIFFPLTGKEYPSHLHVGILNVIVISLCVFCAIFYPNIGDIIRYAGAFCGMVYMFLLPCLIETLLQKREEKETGAKTSVFRHAFHIFIVVFGVVNFFAQFAVKDA